jgi:acetyl esterase/lipase
VREHRVRPAPFAPPRRLDHKVVFSVDTRQRWTCYRVVPRNTPKPTPKVLYVHGGVFIGEILPMHRSLIAKRSVHFAAAQSPSCCLFTANQCAP